MRAGARRGATHDRSLAERNALHGADAATLVGSDTRASPKERTDEAPFRPGHTGRDAVHKYLHDGGELDVIRNGVIYRVIYPVYSPGTHARELLESLKQALA